MDDQNFRILEVLDSYYPVFDGPICLITNYAKSFNKKPGVSCEILVPKYPHYTDDQPFRVNRAFSVSDFGFGVRLPVPQLDFKIKKYLKENRFDVIHAHSPVTMGRFAIRYARKNHIPILFTMHTKFHEEINRSVPIKFLQRFALSFLMRTINRMDYVLAVSEGAADCLRGYGYKGEISIVRNGTDLLLPNKDMTAEIAEIKKEHGLDRVDHVFLFVGRIVVVKKIQNLLRVAALLKSRGMSFRLLIVGDGDYLDDLKKLAEDLSIQDAVVFPGKVLDRDRLSAYYLASDLFLFPSTFDTASLVPLEAAAMKLPSLLVEGCSSAEIVTDGQNGYLAAESVSAWADKIESIVADKQALQQVKEACYREIYRTWDDVTDEVLEKYKECAEDYKHRAR